MEKKPKISIIINCHNGEKFISQCLKSLYHKQLKFRNSFYDNKSTDNSKKILKK